MLTEGAVRSLLTELAETASERARQARQEAATVIAHLAPGPLAAKGAAGRALASIPTRTLPTKERCKLERASSS